MTVLLELSKERRTTERLSSAPGLIGSVGTSGVLVLDLWLSSAELEVQLSKLGLGR